MRLKFLLGFLIVAIGSAGVSIPAAFSSSEKLIRAAKKEGTVVLYHSLSRRVLKVVASEFEKKYGIKVNWTRKGTGGIIRMVSAERLAGVLKCDIVSTGDPTVFVRWKKEGVLMQYVTPNTPNFVKGLAIPGGWYTPSRTTFASMGYSTKRVAKSEVPKSWEDVLDPKWKGRIAIVDPRKSGPARYWLGSIVTKFGWEYIEKLAKNEPLLLKASSTAAVTLISGEVDLLVVSNEHDLLRRKIKGEPVAPIYPKEGMVVKTSPVGICAKAPHPNAAKLWIDWESGPEGQAIATKIGGYAGILKNMKPFYPRDPKVLDPDNMLKMDEMWFMKNKKKLMKKFGQIMSKKGK